ncbi:hypothetical protein BDY19DRAFT_621567 [Irpex rosettiformis]|uniref:Uncharacterized protein n=2 Tax=Irpex rosettiformis TaxID=378272 RepID=A0ACB8TMY9_9APHY|nr:hypothetical protein BDY19DRAFT_708924 [Irpex rosettiformis]KAI0083652.1 hypothetical protein BDY19DRAFT_621567 [Irpex rosettiformis]
MPFLRGGRRDSTLLRALVGCRGWRVVRRITTSDEGEPRYQVRSRDASSLRVRPAPEPVQPRRWHPIDSESSAISSITRPSIPDLPPSGANPRLRPITSPRSLLVPISDGYGDFDKYKSLPRHRHRQRQASRVVQEIRRTPERSYSLLSFYLLCL